MPTNAIATISSKPIFRSTDTLLREWVVKFASIAEKGLSKPFITLWCEALSDLEPEWIEFACRQYMRSMKFMPKPGDIREIIETEKRNRSSGKVSAAGAAAEPHSPEESERQWKSARAAGETYRANIRDHVLTIADLSKTVVKPEPAPIIATKERLDFLARQKCELEAKYGVKK